MPNYSFDNLDERKFEQLIQALALKEFGARLSIFGDGPDGGREATYCGRIEWASGDVWDGYTVVQAKFRALRQSSDRKTDSTWLVEHAKKDLKTNKELGREWPEYYILVSNAKLTSVSKKGGKDRLSAVLDKYFPSAGSPHYAIWDFDHLCRLLDNAPDIRRTYFAETTPSDVLAAMFESQQTGFTLEPTDHLAKLLTDHEGRVRLPRSCLVDEMETTLARGKGVSLVGPPGAGKTTLMAELAEREPGRYLYLSLRNKTAEQVASYLVRRLAFLAGAQLPVNLGGETRCLELLEGLLSGNSLRLLLDDAGPPSTLTTLASLSGVLERSVLASLQSVHVPTVNEVAIVPLAAPEIRDLIGLRNVKLSHADLESLVTRSGGNPLYLEYALSAPRGDAPPGLEQYQAALLDAAEPLGFEALNFFAHSLKPLTVGDLLELLDGKHSRQELRKTLKGLGGVIVESESGWNIFHPTFANYIREQARKDGFQERCYGSLCDRAAQLGDSLLAGLYGLRGNLEVDEETLMSAVFEAAEKQRWLVAEELLSHVLSEKSPLPADNRGWAYLALAEVYRETGRLADARSMAQRADDRSDPASISVKMYRSLLDLESDSYEQAVATLEALLAERQQEQAKETAVLHLNLAWAYLRTGRPWDSHRQARSALELFEKLGDQRGINSALSNISAGLGDTPGSDPKEQLELALQIVEKAKAQGNLRLAALGYNHAAKAQRQLDLYEEAIASSREAVRLCQETGVKEMELTNIANLGNALLDSKRLGEAEAAYVEALEQARALRLRRTEAHAMELLGKLYLLEESTLVKARPLLEGALAIFTEFGDRVRTATSTEKLALVYERQDLPALAISTFVQAGEDFVSLGDWGEAAHCFNKAADIAYAAGEKTRAARIALKAAQCALRDEDPGNANNVLIHAPGLEREVSETYGEILYQFGNGVVDSNFTGVMVNYARYCRWSGPSERERFVDDVLKLAESNRASSRPEVLNSLAMAILQATWLSTPFELALAIQDRLNPLEDLELFIDSDGVETATINLESESMAVRIECLSYDRIEIAIVASLGLIMLAQRSSLASAVRAAGGPKESSMMLQVFSEGQMVKLGIPPLLDYSHDSCLVTFSESAVPFGEPQPLTGLFIHSGFLDSMDGESPDGSIAWLLMNLYRKVVSHFGWKDSNDISARAARRFADRMLRTSESGRLQSVLKK